MRLYNQSDWQEIWEGKNTELVKGYTKAEKDIEERGVEYALKILFRARAYSLMKGRYLLGYEMKIADTVL